MRPLLVILLLTWLSATGSAPIAQESARRQPSGPSVPAPSMAITAATETEYSKVVRPFVSDYCSACHGNKDPKNGLNLVSFATATSLVDERDHWDLVVEKLKSVEMPPIEEEQPEDDARAAVVGWLEKELDRIDRVTPPDPGRVTARRLNRTEYDNTVRELLGVAARPSDDFPQDDSGYGFDNIADVLSLSPVLMEKYIAAADKVARLALFGPPTLEPTLTKLRSEGRRVVERKTVPDAYDVTGLSLPNAFHAVHSVPVDGDYIVRVVLGGLRPAGSEPVTVALWVDDAQVQTVVHDPDSDATFFDDRQDFGGHAVEFKARLTVGARTLAVAIPNIYEGLPTRFSGPKPSARPPHVREFKPPANATPERIAQARKRFDDAQVELDRIPVNGVRVSAVEIGGPYDQATGPTRASHDKIYVCGHLDGKHLGTCAPRILSHLAARAYRRPVAASEMAPIVALARQAQTAEASFEEGLAVGIQAVLVSPDFLFRLERDRAASGRTIAARLSPHELATRLSYFLWASMPDDELRRVADSGTLRRPAVLEAQVRRMLRDPRSRALSEHFGGQWLQFRALESVTRDRDKFPEFEDYLRLSMRRETELFFDHIVREDRPVTDFLEARYSFLNERLARHYGINGVAGPEFRRVDLSASPRGGIFTQGSVLTVSSYATRTSPVLRGKWILDNLLDSPPPEPPPDVPNLDDTAIGTSASMREQLEAHRKNPTCASCHRRMDPLGFGLENFDAVGAWRITDGNFPVDASGALPDGRTFTGPVELRAILTEERDAFSRAIASKLMTYGLGRGLERYDARAIKTIAGRLPAHHYRFSGLVLEIVNSLPFQYRRGATAP